MRHLTAQFGRHFPALAPLVVCSELSTPLSTVAFTGAEHGRCVWTGTESAKVLIKQPARQDAPAGPLPDWAGRR